MEFTCVSRQAQLLTLVTAALGLAAASHFRGAIIQWRPVDPDNFDGRVRVCTSALQKLAIGIGICYNITYLDIVFVRTYIMMCTYVYHDVYVRLFIYVGPIHPSYCLAQWTGSL